MAADNPSVALDADIRAFDQVRAELERTAYGKFVVFHDAQQIGAWDTFEAAATEAVRQFGRGPFLIRQVGAPPVVLPASVMYRPIHA